MGQKANSGFTGVKERREEEEKICLGSHGHQDFTGGGKEKRKENKRKGERKR